MSERSQTSPGFQRPQTPVRGSQNRSRENTRTASQSQANDNMDGVEVSQDTISTEVVSRTLDTQVDVVTTFVKRIVNCRSVAQLVSFVPAVAQDQTKQSLDKVVNAHIKKAAAAFLLSEWRDHLAKESFDRIPELKSLRAPSIQISKLAEEGGSITKTFDEALKEAKKSALTRMIFIKDKEVEALNKLCESKRNSDQISEAWKSVAGNDVSPEAKAILMDYSCAWSLTCSAVSIGENTAQKQMAVKAKKSETVKNTSVKSTDKLPDNPKALEEFVKEIAKRQRQSVMDKSKARKSGKGQRGAGPSKSKNQKNSNKVAKKDRKGKNGKRGTSSKRQQKKR
ncbi:hypothetical protein COCC4DRAFT_46004 [Bipolaris maydis ATCC 48331]|uniref:Uncharacterized protein n=1 Tax=Cochliobolus heterostrophus (strain C4 / ATCC 48331 / race T) TaxID=665024 RepID=N4WVU4_COCH4|nr:uncharacterized protein COCC4DRAFT_46004 [Bipolaris maydis ATCC 48331]ENH98505.1 hypothetical protein COCC4DRAFT_46004 [Bipolaris maydis ATCC 48331]KAJ6194644.1 hypothetical protein J3E72DRAFT_405515 [Bipolaris maydis]KAJ6202260.1 hypothetical protein J3E72DRAFT_410973 [Bipolaris maydis]